MKFRLTTLALTLSLLAAPDAAAQTFPTDDPVIRGIWAEGVHNSQVRPLAQTLMDSIGPRLTGSPEQLAAHEWAVARYREWGIEARNERYGTWRGWRRGPTHVDLVAPRVRTLDATMLAWSPGTEGPVEGPVILLPPVREPSEFQAWLPRVRGAFVLISFPQPTCRPDHAWAEHADAGTLERMRQDRQQAAVDWRGRLDATGIRASDVPRALEAAGAAGVLTSSWTGGYGASRIFDAGTRRAPTLHVGCEDYGLLARLAGNGQGPRLRVDARAESLGEVPTFNTIAEIRGRELPDEYVVLSAHFDSWDGASGATDNGTGTVVMMEAMRILKAAYPNPRRTILVGHWSGEEQGLHGSRAFAVDNRHVVDGMQVLLNQDNGTGRIRHISMSGLTQAHRHFERWLAAIPRELTRGIALENPGLPATGGSDEASFICEGAPAFRLRSDEWDYRDYTWHTNLDTFDKIVLEQVRDNAVLTAMLAYMASEDPERVSRERRELVAGRGTAARRAAWPVCREPARSAR